MALLWGPPYALCDLLDLCPSVLQIAGCDSIAQR